MVIWTILNEHEACGFCELTFGNREETEEKY